MSALRGLLLAAAAALAAGCATLDELAVAETHRLEDAPYYVDTGAPVARGACALVLPVALDPALAETLGYADRQARFEPIVAALNARLAARGNCYPLAPAALAGRAPRVYVGSAEGDAAPAGVGEQRLPQDRFAPMVLHLERPDPAWRAAVAAATAQAGQGYAIQLHLGVSQYMKGRSGLFRKEVALGSGHRVPIRFLTAEDKPVEVLHLTGTLVDAGGKPLRAGAEGILLRDTPFLAQTVDLVRVLDDVTLERVLTEERRQDLPGTPPSWQVALDNLLAQLTRGAVTVPAR